MPGMVNLGCPACFVSWSGLLIRFKYYHWEWIEWGIDWRPFCSDICKHLPHHQSYYFGPRTSELSEISNSSSEFTKLKNLLGKIENRNIENWLRGILDLRYTSTCYWQAILIDRHMISKKKISLQPSLTHRSNNSFCLVCGL